MACAALAALGCGTLPASGLAQVSDGTIAAPGGATALPGTGLDTARVGDLRSALQTYLPGAPVRAIGPNFQVFPSIGVDVGVTDNSGRTNGGRSADVFTLITPSIFVTADTAHIQANASYTPAFSIYANGGQSRVDQFGQAGALVTFVPDTFFLDLRGSISESSLTGGFATADGRGFNNNNQVTSVALSATPYVQHRFGGWGTGQLSYTIAQTFEDTPNGNVFVVNPALAGNSLAGQPFYGSNGDLTTQQERASFTTGENFGRINNVTVLSATQYSGAGTYRGAYRNEITTTTGYALTRAFTALGMVGYQDLHYAGTPPYNVNEPIWSVGGRYAPNPNLSLTLTYGRRDGFNDFAGDAYWSPTARTAIFARYSTGVTSDAEQYQNVLNTTNVGPTGLLTDRTSGAPVSGNTGFFGAQNGVFQLRSISVTGLLSLNRDSFSATVTNERRTAVTNTVANTGQSIVPAGTSTTGTFGTVTWGHQLSDRLTSTVVAGYGVNDNGNALGLGSSSQTSFTASAQLSYIFSATLTGRVLYTHTSVSGAGYNGLNSNGFNSFGPQTGSYEENVLLAGVRKSF